MMVNSETGGLPSEIGQLIHSEGLDGPNQGGHYMLNADRDTLLVVWIKKAKKGSIGHYQKIYDSFAARVLNFIYRMVNSLEEAEDLTQDTFIAAYRKLGSLEDNTKFEPWLFRIAINNVYRRHRRRAPVSVSVDALDEDGHLRTQLIDRRKSPEEEFQAREFEGIVAQVIADLPQKYREVLLLSVVSCLSYKEIAEVVGRSLASIKTDIHRARLQVRKKVEDYLAVA